MSGELVFVVGTARSGTSALSTLVENMGAQTLPKSVAGNYNPDYQESAVLNALCVAMHPWHKLDRLNMDPAIINGMVAYLYENWTDRDRPMVVKSPVFPFILQALQIVADRLEATPHYLCVVRNEQDQIRSLHDFTMNNWDDQHWVHLLSRARHAVREDIQPSRLAMWVVYEDMLADWRKTAANISRKVPGLSLPMDGGIRPELNHQRVNDIAEKTA